MRMPPQSIEAGMKTGKAQEICVACEQFLQSLSRFYQVSPCGIRVLASRPLRIRENWSSELFGDYDPSTMAIRVCAPLLQRLAQRYCLIGQGIIENDK
jgi:hypothetical protein